jgi:hypothetical protein
MKKGITVERERESQGDQEKKTPDRAEEHVTRGIELKLGGSVSRIELGETHSKGNSHISMTLIKGKPSEQGRKLFVSGVGEKAFDICCEDKDLGE